MASVAGVQAEVAQVEVVLLVPSQGSLFYGPGSWLLGFRILVWPVW
jgi:hypothetical protein